MRVAIYARVSTTDQNCSLQLEQLREYVKNSKWTIVEEFIDEGISGFKKTRPAFENLLKLCRQKKIDIVCCSKIDRFSRSVLNLKLTLDELERLNVRFMAISQGIDTDKNNPMGRFMINILATMAEFELELNRERRSEGIKRAMDNGVHFGRPKAIFRRDRAIEMFQAGESLRTIARELGTSLGSIQRALQGVSKPCPQALPFSVDSTADCAA